MSSVQTPILLFGESYQPPNIFYRPGFLAPDPVVVVDRGGDDTVLWTSRLEEGRARKEARVGRVRCTEELDWAEKMSRAGAEQDAWAVLVESICRAEELGGVVVEGDFPVIIPDHLRGHDLEGRARGDLYRRPGGGQTPPAARSVPAPPARAGDHP